MSGKAKLPTPPRSLRTAGKRTWKALLSDLRDGWELTNRELELLRNACAQADLTADLEAALKETGLVVEGAAGQKRLNAAATELRQSRLALARLLSEIPIPDEDGEPPVSPSSRRAREAANSRWSRKKGKNG